MPVISMFYGLIVTMYYLDTKQHKLPHIHVKYGEKEAVYQIPDGSLLEGSLPANKEKINSGVDRNSQRRSNGKPATGSFR
jgi:hypothetical protein